MTAKLRIILNKAAFPLKLSASDLWILLSIEYFCAVKAPVYLDNNATTPLDKRVLDAMMPYLTDKFGNASSKTHAFGWVSNEAVKVARIQVADLINCLEQEIVFTSGATEAVNLAIKGIWENYKSKGDHIITVKTEHKAVLDTCAALEKRGARVTYLSVDREGLIDLEELKSALTDKTILVSVMYVNNETGVMQPIKQIAELVHAAGSIFMCDASQAVGKISIDVEKDHIDLLCLSAHKFYGPKGVGALYIRRKGPRVILHPQIDGGGHERGIRSGTLNVPGIVGLGKACEISKVEMPEDAARISELRSHLERMLCSLPDVFVNGSKQHRLYNITNLCFQGIRSESLIGKIPHIAVAMGSACTSALPEPSHVLKAMGLSDVDSYCSVRFSLGKTTSEEEISEVVKSVSSALKQIAGSGSN